MDLISKIVYFGNSLTGKKNDTDKTRTGHKKGAKNSPSDSRPPSKEARLGQKLDTTA